MRRLDEVLSPAFTSDLRELDSDEVRRRKHIAELEETDLSYLRRLVQGRIDIVKAEMARRDPSHDDRNIIAHLADILAADEEVASSGRFIALIEPSRVGNRRRQAEAMIADPRFSEIESRNTAELEEFLGVLGHHERQISEQRKSVQQVIDSCAGELARRAAASLPL